MVVVDLVVSSFKCVWGKFLFRYEDSRSICAVPTHILPSHERKNFRVGPYPSAGLSGLVAYHMKTIGYK